MTDKKEDAAGSSDDDVPLSEVAARRKEDANSEKHIYLDIELWKANRQALNGTFKAARKNLMQYGAWELPPDVPGNSFADIANETLEKMDK